MTYIGIHITDDLTWTVNTQHTEEIKAKTVLPTSAEEVQSIRTHQLCVLTASLGMGTVQPVTAAPNHQSISPYSAGDLQEKTYLPAPKVL